MVRIAQKNDASPWSNIDPLKLMLGGTLLGSFYLLRQAQIMSRSQIVTNPVAQYQMPGVEQQRFQEQNLITTFNPILRHLKYNVDSLYDHILNTHPGPNAKLVVMEVGCFRLKQSKFAAEKGFKVLSYEASPTNYKKMLAEHNILPKTLKTRINVHNNAVSSKSGEVLLFDAIGGTGDHVSGMNLDAAQDRYDAKEKVEVRSVALDDVISELPFDEFVHLLKIDTQGHEGYVFQGLQKTIQLGKIRYILFEYWVDAIDKSEEKPIGTCSGVENILNPLVKAGYTLFDLSVNNHPNTKARKRITPRELFYRPLEFNENCMWYVNKGKSALEYSMGYWTDVLAVYNGEFGFSEKGL